MTTWLSPHFALEELVASQTASREGLDNTPTPEIVRALTVAARGMENVRDLLGGHPINVSSGYRSPAVNAAIHGATHSAHMEGWAVDFTCYEAGTPLEICRTIAAAQSLVFDQLIQEGTWVHISFAPTLRREVLTKHGNGYVSGLGS